jgi:hypothetical protein
MRRRCRGRERERAKVAVDSIITTPLPATTFLYQHPYTPTPFLPHDSTPSSRQTIFSPNLPLWTQSRLYLSPRRRRSYSFHRHKILSISADSYTSTPTARHYQKHPAIWPTSPRRHRLNRTNISPILNNPRSLHNHSTTRLPPPWIKKLPSHKRCCLQSLAAS